MVVGSRVDLWFGGLELLDFLEIYGALCISKLLLLSVSISMGHCYIAKGTYLVVSLVSIFVNLGRTSVSSTGVESIEVNLY